MDPFQTFWRSLLVTSRELVMDSEAMMQDAARIDGWVGGVVGLLAVPRFNPSVENLA